MSAKLILLTVPWIIAAGTDGLPSAVVIKPLAISLDAPPAVETRRSCVLLCRGGAMHVLSVAATDPAVVVDLREDTRAGTHVVTATLPAGYRTASTEPVEILVRTDLATNPLIRVPVRVWSGKIPNDPGWLTRARSLIGEPLPTVVVDRPEGGELEIRPVEGKVTVVVFSAHWCGHCDERVPVIENVWKDYAELGVQFLGVAGNRGNNQGTVAAAERWGVDWPLGADRARTAVRRFGVWAFPVVFVVGMDGIVEAVHGRHSNTPVNNGLDNLDMELRTELDILRAGGTRADFPDWEALAKAPVTTQPVSARPARPVLAAEHEIRGADCGPGAPATFKIPLRNTGLQALELRKVGLPEGVSINPDYVKEIPPGGLSLLRCQVIAPVQPGAFSRCVKIETNDPGNPVAEITLVGNVAGSGSRTSVSRR